MKNLAFLFGLLIIAWIGTACGTQTVVPVTPTTGDDSQVPQAVEQAKAELANQLDVAVDQVQVLEFSQDPPCIGWASDPDACGEVQTTGYGGILLHTVEQYEFRVDATGQEVRIIPGAAIAARETLSHQEGVPLEDVLFASIEETMWPDSCLGVSPPGLMCLQVVTPGYLVILQHANDTYEYRTDRTGSQVLLAKAPGDRDPDSAIIWEGQMDGDCQTASFRTEGVAYGACGGPLVEGSLVSQVREEEMIFFLDTYAPFEAVVPTGKITFRGSGGRGATAVEKRMIAEWARLAAQEAVFGRGGASWGLALSWYREGGIAGFCDNLDIYVTGEAVAYTCPGGGAETVRRGRLTVQELEQLYEWVDAFEPSEYLEADDAVADAMLIRISFFGEGDETIPHETTLEMLSFASEIHARLETPVAQGGDSEHPAESIAAARQALEEYFQVLNWGDYGRAAELYGGSYEVLQGYNPDIPPDEHAMLMEAGCRYNGLMCRFSLRRIVDEEQVQDGEYLFLVEFSNPEGSLFELGPCCGADPSTQPTLTQFPFRLLEEEGAFLVQDLPVYVP